MADSYGEIFADMIDRRARHEDRGDIFRKIEVSRNQFYNVVNPNRTTSGGNPYPFPMEWMVRATREFKDYELVRAVASDCNGVFVSLDEIQELQDLDAPQVLETIKSILGRVCKEQKR